MTPSEKLVKQVFNADLEENYLKIVSTNVWIHKGTQLSPEKIQTLRENAEAFKESLLWKVLSDEVRFHTRRMYDEATSMDALYAPKMLQYIHDIIESKLKAMSV